MLKGRENWTTLRASQLSSGSSCAQVAEVPLAIISHQLKIRYSWRRAWQPSPVFLPGESHGQRSLAGHGPWGRKESDTTEATKQARTVGPGRHRLPCPLSRLSYPPLGPSLSTPGEAVLTCISGLSRALAPAIPGRFTVLSAWISTVVSKLPPSNPRLILRPPSHQLRNTCTTSRSLSDHDGFLTMASQTL